MPWINTATNAKPRRNWQRVRNAFTSWRSAASQPKSRLVLRMRGKKRPNPPRPTMMNKRQVNEKTPQRPRSRATNEQQVAQVPPPKWRKIWTVAKAANRATVLRRYSPKRKRAISGRDGQIFKPVLL